MNKKREKGTQKMNTCKVSELIKTDENKSIRKESLYNDAKVMNKMQQLTRKKQMYKTGEPKKIRKRGKHRDE